MKRHTNKKIKYFGIVLASLVVMGGIGAFCNPTWAMDQEPEIEVQFTINSELKVTVDKEEITIDNLAVGTAQESDPVTVTVATNNVNGYYLSATAGESTGSTALTSSNGDQINHLDSTNNETENGLVSDAAALADNTWGVKYATDEAGLTSSKYKGLPLDGGDNGAGGLKMLDLSSLGGNNSVKVKVGVKAGKTLKAGTYQNKINFYAVTK